MDWLEQNLDAYRIIAEILNDLRQLAQKTLEAKYGSSWYEKGLPQSVFDRLIEVKEQEKAIDWYETEYQQIINYAQFPELLEIIESDPEAFKPLFSLAPSSALLNARFLELEVMRAKLGRARPVSEAELSFLSTFHLRFRKATGDLRKVAAEPSNSRDQDPPVADEVETVKEKTEDESPNQHGTSGEDLGENKAEEENSDPADESPEGSETESGPPPTTEQNGDVPEMPPPSGNSASPRIAPPRRPVQTMSRGRAAAAVSAAEQMPDHDPAADEDPQEDSDTPEIARGTLSQALEDGDNTTILRELYREVTSLAESIWSSDVPPAAMAWDQIRQSNWYEDNFSKLGLKPLSDFYDVFSTVEAKIDEGVARDQLQAYLKEVNFAKILLSMRDMFQRNRI